MSPHPGADGLVQCLPSHLNVDRLHLACHLGALPGKVRFFFYFGKRLMRTVQCDMRWNMEVEIKACHEKEWTYSHAADGSMNSRKEDRDDSEWSLSS